MPASSSTGSFESFSLFSRFLMIVCSLRAGVEERAGQVLSVFSRLFVWGFFFPNNQAFEDRTAVTALLPHCLILSLCNFVTRLRDNQLLIRLGGGLCARRATCTKDAASCRLKYKCSPLLRLILTEEEWRKTQSPRDRLSSRALTFGEAHFQPNVSPCDVTLSSTDTY